MNEIGKQIRKYREQKGLSQAELATKMHVAHQTISKWELGYSSPESRMLPHLCKILSVDLHQIIGHAYRPATRTFYDEEYAGEEYYWGLKPSNMCYDLLKMIPPTQPIHVLDIGCGEGQNAVFLSRCGYLVSAFDLSNNGIEKGRELAERHGVKVDFFQADINSFRLAEPIDIVFSSGVLQYIENEKRAEVMEHLLSMTKIGGFHFHNAFVKKPFISDPPEDEPIFNYWHSGELFSYYTDWKIHYCEERIFPCTSSGVAHEHCMNIVIAEKMVP